VSEIKTKGRLSDLDRLDAPTFLGGEIMVVNRAFIETHKEWITIGGLLAVIITLALIVVYAFQYNNDDGRGLHTVIPHEMIWPAGSYLDKLENPEVNMVIISSQNTAIIGQDCPLNSGSLSGLTGLNATYDGIGSITLIDQGQMKSGQFEGMHAVEVKTTGSAINHVMCGADKVLIDDGALHRIAWSARQIQPPITTVVRQAEKQAETAQTKLLADEKTIAAQKVDREIQGLPK
jgi:hypothetical protein